MIQTKLSIIQIISFLIKFYVNQFKYNLEYGGVFFNFNSFLYIDAFNIFSENVANGIYK